MNAYLFSEHASNLLSFFVDCDSFIKVDYNVIAKSCNLWRNFDDINSSWKSILSIIDYYDHNQDKHIPTHGPGQWHDPDMVRA